MALKSKTADYANSAIQRLLRQRRAMFAKRKPAQFPRFRKIKKNRPAIKAQKIIKNRIQIGKSDNKGRKQQSE